MNRIIAGRAAFNRLCGVCFVSIVLAACGGAGGGTAADADTTRNNSVDNGEDDCSVAGINRWVDERMRDTYIYSNQVPELDLEGYTDPVALVRDLRVAPDVYSSLVDQARDEELISNSSVTRFGFWLQQASDGKQRFASISGNSPMEIAGIQRGDELQGINGVPIEDITDEQWREFVVGEPDEALTAVYTVKSGNNASEEVMVTKATYTEKTVPVFGTYEQTNNQVGYIEVSAFRGTTTDELDNAVQSLVNAGISELILDLRYNGGGFTRVARKLASQIAGPAFVGEVYSHRNYNDKYSAQNIEQLIEEQALNLSLSRLFVLTTADTASASETLINGLSPLIDVVVIGDVTEGKPYTSVSQDYCGKRLNAMSTITTNGVGDSVINGIIPNCEVTDDYLAPTNSRRDALTDAAFVYMQSGACPGGQSGRASVDVRQG